MTATREGNIRVLVADDDELIRDVLGEFVGRFYDCTSVGSAEEALELLGRETFHLVVCDVTMSGMTGLEMVPRVLSRAPETVCVMISGAQAVETAVEALRVGAFDYLTKPFDLSQVEAVVRRAVEHQQLLATKRRYEAYLEEAIRERTAQLDEALTLLEDTYRTTLRALVAALEMRDTDTHGHSERVVAFSLRLGRELGLDREQMRSLEFGSLLHDIGKIGVPDAILRKPAGLTEAEWAKMRRHPDLGRQILAGIKFLEGAALVVAQHHERWDGTGYPAALRGAGIDLNARLFAVADAFDAITSDRVYRAGKPYEEAAAELEKWAGTQFDPEIVAAFRRVPKDEWEELRVRVGVEEKLKGHGLAGDRAAVLSGYADEDEIASDIADADARASSFSRMLRSILAA
jgi:response regulator RpfG family c-di-GMP phosphodiesterase